METIHQTLQETLEVTIEDLPDEVLEFILGFLPPYKDLQNCMNVCKRWCGCAQSKFTLLFCINNAIPHFFLCFYSKYFKETIIIMF